MKTDDFDYELPEELIAQAPSAVRDECRLLVMRRETGALEDCIFRDILDYLRPGDLLVANETRVRPARLLGNKRSTGGAAEVFLLRPASAENLELCGVPARALVPNNKEAYWEALVRPGKRLKPGAIVDFTADASRSEVVMSAEIVGFAGDEGQAKGERVVKLTTEISSLDEALHLVGNTPLPPYIKDYTGDKEMYQTVYSRSENSAAAPTAGLHFTPELIDRICNAGIKWETVDLEVGLDTFQIIDEADPEQHKMHTELFSVPQKTVDAVLETKTKGGRVIAVGTTSVRSLESAAMCATDELLTACDHQATSLYILPGYQFRVVDGLVTNFHVPRSTLMMMVSALSSRENLLHAYEHAIEERYRFFSFGDAMLII